MKTAHSILKMKRLITKSEVLRLFVECPDLTTFQKLSNLTELPSENIYLTIEEKPVCRQAGNKQIIHPKNDIL